MRDFILEPVDELPNKVNRSTKSKYGSCVQAFVDSGSDISKISAGEMTFKDKKVMYNGLANSIRRNFCNACYVCFRKNEIYLVRMGAEV